MCMAFNKGAEKHGGGHLSLKVKESVARKLALDECKYYHGKCKIITCRKVFK